MKICIIINSENFPIGLASIEKIKLLAEGLHINGYRVYVLNTFSNIDKYQYPYHKTVGKHLKTIYIYSSGKRFKISRFIKLIYFPSSLLKEIIIIKRISKNASDKKIILQYTHIILVIYYYLISKVFKIDLFINSMENHSKSVKGSLFDKYACLFSKGMILTSHTLKDLSTKSCKEIKTLILPATVDFDKFTNNNSINVEIKNYSIFVASTAYLNTFNFIIESFEKLLLTKIEHNLILIINGRKDVINKLKYRIESSKASSRIFVYTSVPYEKLIELYIGALLLHIPLFDNARDKARFPHKIGEYTASRRPILTTRIGEIPYYFENNKSAFIVDKISSKNYSSVWYYALKNPNLANDIGFNGYKVGVKYFDYHWQASEIIDFMTKKQF